MLIYQDVDTDGEPDLSLDRVLGDATKGFDPKMLLDLFEEQFHLPATFVEFGDGQIGQREIVGQKYQALLLRGIKVTNTVVTDS